MMKCNKLAILSIGFLALMLVSMLGSSTVNAVAISENDARATYVCYFINPSGGDTVSGDVVIDFYGTYRGRTLYEVRAAVYQGGSALTSWVSMSYAGGNHWEVTWDTASFDDGTGYQLRARAYRRAGKFRTFYCNDLTIENGGGSVDTTPPTCDITNPTNGATVSGTVSITVSASDNVAVDRVGISIDGGAYSYDTSAPYSFSWDTTGESNGGHTIDAIAYDTSDNTATDSISVTVDNGGGGGNELTSGETVYSSLAAQYDTEMWTIEVGANCESMHSVLNCGSADFDLYGRLGAEPTTSTYDWRGYTTGGEDILYDFPGAGTWYIMVRSYSGTGAYDLTVTLDYGSPPEPWGTGGKYAIIVGISDYGYISDLSYCDEDATDWYNQLNAMGWECRVYGDGHIGDYPRYDGKATESVVRSAMQGLAAHAQSGDQVAFITSGHGSGDGSGSSFLCMWDCSGSAGCYYDTEVAADVDQFAFGVNVFVFIDHCYSGGMGPELMALSNNDNIYCATTCTEDGYGWDSGANQNGLWTYYFLDYSWQSHFGSNPGQSMESVFDYAHDNYPYGAPSGDEPQEFDGNTGSYFYLN
jgi:hypothetical protein